MPQNKHKDIFICLGRPAIISNLNSPPLSLSCLDLSLLAVNIVLFSYFLHYLDSTPSLSLSLSLSFAEERERERVCVCVCVRIIIFFFLLQIASIQVCP